MIIYELKDSNDELLISFKSKKAAIKYAEDHNDVIWIDKVTYYKKTGYEYCGSVWERSK